MKRVREKIRWKKYSKNNKTDVTGTRELVKLNIFKMVSLNKKVYRNFIYWSLDYSI